MEYRSVLTHPAMIVVLILTAILIAIPLLSGLQPHGRHGNMFVMTAVMILPVIIAVFLMIVTLQHFNTSNSDVEANPADSTTRIEQLQEEYVTGELSEAEFERRLERQLEEDADNTNQSHDQRAKEADVD